MAARKILMIWEQGGHWGHLGKLLPVASALRDRGDHPAFVMPVSSKTVAMVKSAGFAAMTPPTRPQSAGARNSEAPICHAEVLLRSGFSSARQALDEVQAWHRLFDEFRVDVVVLDGAPVALYAALCRGLPVLNQGHGFDIPPQHASPCFAPWRADAAQRCADAELALQTVLDQMTVALSPFFDGRVPATMKALFQPQHSVLCTWPELDHFDRPEAAAQTPEQYVGPVWGDLPGALELTWPQSRELDSDRPKVLCYLYSQYKGLKQVSRSLIDGGADVFLVVPGVEVPFRMELEASGIHVADSAVALPPLLKTCSAVICHGGVGLTSMALHAGKPLLLLPEYMEHVVLAYRLSRQGLALATVKGDEPKILREKVNGLLTDRLLAQRIKGFSTRYLSFTPTGAVQQIVERIGYTPKPAALNIK